MKMLAHRTVVHQEVCLVRDKRWKKKGGKEDGLLFGEEVWPPSVRKFKSKGGRVSFKGVRRLGGSFDVVS